MGLARSCVSTWYVVHTKPCMILSNRSREILCETWYDVDHARSFVIFYGKSFDM